jgi:hypothetical protein
MQSPRSQKQINFDEATVEEDIYACAEAEYAPVFTLRNSTP